MIEQVFVLFGVGCSYMSWALCLFFKLKNEKRNVSLKLKIHVDSLLSDGEVLLEIVPCHWHDFAAACERR